MIFVLPEAYSLTKSVLGSYTDGVEDLPDNR